ncbi:uncharacterized plasma membrane protein YNL194C [Trichomonascus vanleenenianus]|uniref:SUR7/PalI family protein n=1 Tax=Trichomonascus vanleenenianus TaxID=2268995 RepID=UPI003ECAEABE
MKRPISASISLFLLAGSILLLFFIVLAGAKDSSPLNKFFWLQADTSAIPGAPPETRWTFYGYCEVKDGNNYNCSSNVAAFAFQPDRTFGTTTGVPSDFINNHSTYYYLTRFSYAFFLIALFFSVVTLIFCCCAMFSRLGSAISASMNFIAWLFAITAAALATGAYTMARNKFNNGANLGVKLTAFSWTVVACLIITQVLFCIGWCGGESRRQNRDFFVEKKSPDRRRGFFSVRNRKESSGHESQEPIQPGIQPVSSFERNP